MNVEKQVSEKKMSFLERIKEHLLFALRLSDDRTVKLYNGYGNKSSCIIFGHTFRFGPIPRRRYRMNFLSNTLALLRLFMVKPVGGVTLVLKWEGKTFTTK